jgi:hypothetical protein
MKFNCWGMESGVSNLADVIVLCKCTSKKLLEVSLTEEMLEAAAREYESAGETTQAKVLRSDAKILSSMCKEAEEFGKALKSRFGFNFRVYCRRR